jgi:hypothetical protein
VVLTSSNLSVLGFIAVALLAQNKPPANIEGGASLCVAADLVKVCEVISTTI